MEKLDDLLKVNITTSTDVDALIAKVVDQITDAEWQELIDADVCEDGYHHILIDDLGFPQCAYCLLTFDGWKAVKNELSKKYYESGEEYVKERLLTLKKVSSKVKRWNKSNFAITVSFFRPDREHKTLRLITRVFYNPWDQANRK